MSWLIVVQAHSLFFLIYTCHLFFYPVTESPHCLSHILLVAFVTCEQIYVTVGMDKPLARLIVVHHLDVDKDRVLWSGVLDTPLSLRVLLLKE